MQTKWNITTIGNTIRATEWWEYKLVPLLGVGYATAFVTATPMTEAVSVLFTALIGLIIGAVFASLINDVTDVDDDVAVGKKNYMAGFSEKTRWLFPIGSMLIGVVFGFFIYPDILSLFFYALAWLSFILYSIPPIRLKTKGAIGVFCCASGESLFPALFIASRLTYAAECPVQLWWFLAVAIWALTFGLRAILWHQFRDRENDLQTNASTFATRVSRERFRPIAICLFIMELVAVVGILMQLKLPITWLALLLYIILAFIRYKQYANTPIILFTPEHAHWQMMMADFYQVFLPISLLIIASLDQSWGWCVLLGHIVLFPNAVFFAIRDYLLVA